MSNSDWDIVRCPEFVLEDSQSIESDGLSEKSYKLVDSFEDLASSVESVILDNQSEASGGSEQDPASRVAQFVIADADSVLDSQSDGSDVVGEKDVASAEYVIADGDSSLGSLGTPGHSSEEESEDSPENQQGDEELEATEFGHAPGVADVKAADLLWRGWWDGEVAVAAEIDKEEGAALGRVLVVGTTAALGERARQLERDCREPPKAYVCSRTGQLMLDPVTDDEGVVCDRVVADDPCCRSPELKSEIEAFRRHHTHSILRLVPELIREGLPQVATRLLRLAEDLSEGLKESSTLQARVLELTTQLPCVAENLRGELILLMVRRAQFRDLVLRFAELQVAKHYSHLSAEDLSRLYSVAWLEEWKLGGQVHRTRMDIGRALVARLSLVEATEPERDVGPKKLQILFDLHSADPGAEDLYEPLAVACVQRLPVSGDNNLGGALAKLPLKVVEAAIKHVETGSCSTAWRSSAVLVSAAQRSKRQKAARLYRAALQIDPDCEEARQGLTSALLHAVSSSAATRQDRADLARLLLSQGTFSLIAHHYDALRYWIKHEELQLSDRQALATALFAVDQTRPASRVALSVAQELDKRVKRSAEDANETLDWYIRSCSWAGSPGAAQEALDHAWFRLSFTAFLWSFPGQN